MRLYDAFAWRWSRSRRLGAGSTFVVGLAIDFLPEFIHYDFFVVSGSAFVVVR